MTHTVTIEVRADISLFMVQMRRAVLAARNVNRVRRGLPVVVRPLRAAPHGRAIPEVGATR